MLNIILIINSYILRELIVFKKMFLIYKKFIINDNQVSMMLTSLKRLSYYKKSKIKYLGYYKEYKSNKCYSACGHSEDLGRGPHPVQLNDVGNNEIAYSNFTHSYITNGMKNIYIGKNKDGSNCYLVPNVGIKQKSELEKYQITNYKSIKPGQVQDEKIMAKSTEVIEKLIGRKAINKQFQTVEKELKNSNIKE